MERRAGAHHPRLKWLRSLQKKRRRQEAGVLVLEGVRLVEEGLRAGCPITLAVWSPRLLTSERGARLLEELRQRAEELLWVEDALLERLSDTETPQGILAVTVRPEQRWEELMAGSPSALLAVDALQDPGNVGTLIRTALAAGLDGVVLGRGCADAANPKVVRSTMGALFHLPVVQGVDLPPFLAVCRERGMSVLGGDPRAEVLFTEADYRGPTVLVVGNEARGLGEPVARLLTAAVRIPLRPGVESLNAAVAGALLMYEWWRQRGFASPGKSV
ncbi:MAG: RNA methyltransferase [Bacillota bacterium]|nr:RNA methyltransferase [Bacillota bacterium]